MTTNAIISFPLFGDGFVLDLPRYFTIFGFRIFYYGIIIGLGYFLAGLYVIKRKKLFNLTSDNLLDAVLLAVIFGLVGARLYFALFNFNDYFGAGQWANLLRIRDGGLAIYGGIIASGLAFVVYSLIKKIPVGRLLDAAAFGLFIGQAIGRWGNLFNREAYGEVTELPWRMGLTRNGVTEYVHPAFLYESLWNIVGFLIIHIISKKTKTRYPGQYFLFYAAWYGAGRFMIEGLRVDSLFVWGTDLRVSQLVAAASCLIALIILFVNFLRGKRVNDDDNPTDGKDDDDGKDENVSEDDLNDKNVGEDVVNELSELDGASNDDVAKESKESNLSDFFPEIHNKDKPAVVNEISAPAAPEQPVSVPPIPPVPPVPSMPPVTPKADNNVTLEHMVNTVIPEQPQAPAMNNNFAQGQPQVPVMNNNFAQVQPLEPLQVPTVNNNFAPEQPPEPPPAPVANEKVKVMPTANKPNEKVKVKVNRVRKVKKEGK